MIDYKKGKRLSIPEIVADPKTLEEFITRYYAAIILMRRGEIDQVIDIIGDGKDFVKKRLFSRFWAGDEFRQQAIQEGLVDYWRQSGNWGDMCRPLGEDDFECGVFE